MLAQVGEKFSILSHALVEPLQLFGLKARIRDQIPCVGHVFMISGVWDGNAKDQPKLTDLSVVPPTLPDPPRPVSKLV